MTKYFVQSFATVWMQRLKRYFRARKNVAAYKSVRAKDQALYTQLIQSLDPKQLGVDIRCPACGRQSWVRFPRKAYHFMPDLLIACPANCGYYGPVENFAPSSLPPLSTYDVEHSCSRDGTEFKTFGAVFRCPMCAIENPRELMDACAHRVLTSNSNGKDELADYLGAVVSTFDGVMRECNRIAVRNFAGSNSIHPQVRSFQDINSAWQALQGSLDISGIVQDWDQFKRTFQKRHALSHSLGVIDEKYVTKTGIPRSEIGTMVQLSKAEVDQFARDCQAIVRTYFGFFLS